MQSRRLAVSPPDLTATAALALASFAFHLPAIALGRIPMQDDVKVFYFPLLVATSEALRHGTLPFWSPSLFGGYPLFADGEAGMLYPLHLLLLPWLSPEAAVVWLRVIHTFLAGLFTYLLLRTLECRPAASVIGALVYALSGYAAGQVVHSNVFHSIVWLPLELALLERALRAQGLRRLHFALLAGAVVGIQALALHIHFTMLSALTLTCFTAYRAAGLAFRPRAAAEPNVSFDPCASPKLQPSSWGSSRCLILCREAAYSLDRVARAGATLAVVGALGIGLAAAQLFPLAELGMQTYRGIGLESEAVTDANSLSVASLVTLLFPHIFDTANGGYWGPWVKWETTLYVGFASLCFGLLGLLTRSGPYRAFFAGLALLALLGAFGRNAPLPLWDTLHEVPPFNALRSPGRFILLFVLSTSVLAAYGVDWLDRRVRPHPRWSATAALIALASPAMAWILLREARIALERSPEVRPVLESYLAIPGVPTHLEGTRLTVERVSSLLVQALRTDLFVAAWPLTLCWLVPLAAALWLLHPRVRPLATVCTFSVLLVDLSIVAYTFHPYGSLHELRPQPPAVLLQPSSAPFRVYTPPTAEDKRTQVEPNRLLAVGLEEADGYSSLAPDRHSAYVTAVQYSGNDLLDLWNARYVVQRVRRELFPSYGGTVFHPERPLFSGRRAKPGSSGVVLPDGGPARADEVHVVAALWDAARVPDGAIAAAIKLVGEDGTERTVLLRVGAHVSDARLHRPGATHEYAHRAAETAFEYQRADPALPRYGERLSYARLYPEAPLTVRAVEVLNLLPEGGLEVFGIGLWNTAAGEMTQARALAKLRLVHEDSQIRVFENTTALPRAFLVPSAVAVPAGRDALSVMVDGAFDLRQTAVVECGTPGSHCGLPPSLFSVPATERAVATGTAIFRAYEDHWSVIQASSEHGGVLVFSDSFYPGWQAWVDGIPSPIVRTNSLFRGVYVPPGSHTVTFAFAPMSVALGGAVTLATAGILLCTWLALAAAWALRHRPALDSGSFVPNPRESSASAAD